MTPTPRGADTGVSAARLDAARVAVAVVFVVNGFAFASWVSRIPDLRDRLLLSPGQVGLLLLCLSAGTVLALPLSGVVVGRLGPARTVLAGAALTGLGLLVMGVGLLSTSVPLTGLALFLYGAGTSSWDVAMNVEAADVERRLARAIMPRFHAGFSLGTVAGALLGAGTSALGVPLAVQQLVLCGLVVAAVALTVGRFLPVAEHPEDHVRPSAWSAWREPRTIAIGLVVMCFALCEGIANDWLALGIVDGYGADPALGSLGFALFVVAMTLGRFFGGAIQTRHGRVPVLRATGLLVVVGSLTVVLAPALPLAFVGALVWGLGASLGFPMGMTAAADDPVRAAVRVSVVSSIGYCAFLGGPPLLGALGDQVGVRDSLLVAVGAALVGIALSRAVAEQEPVSGTPSAAAGSR